MGNLQTQLGSVSADIPPPPHNDGTLPLQDGQVTFLSIKLFSAIQNTFGSKKVQVHFCITDLFIPNFLLSRSTLHVLCMFYGSVEREFFCIVYRIECISSMTAFIRRWAVQIKSLLGPLWSWNEKSKILIIWFRKLWLHVTPGHQPETETRGRQNKQKVHLLIHLHRRR